MSQSQLLPLLHCLSVTWQGYRHADPLCWPLQGRSCLTWCTVACQGHGVAYLKKGAKRSEGARAATQGCSCRGSCQGRPRRLSAAEGRAPGRQGRAQQHPEGVLTLAGLSTLVRASVARLALCEMAIPLQAASQYIAETACTALTSMEALMLLGQLTHLLLSCLPVIPLWADLLL